MRKAEKERHLFSSTNTKKHTNFSKFKGENGKGLMTGSVFYTVGAKMQAIWKLRPAFRISEAMDSDLKRGEKGQTKADHFSLDTLFSLAS